MEKKQRLFYALTGALAGLLSGLLGTGGGLVVVPMLLGPIHLEPKRAFATSVCIMLPICAVSAGVYLWQGRMTLAPAWPYMAGGCVGGIVCGKVYGRDIAPLAAAPVRPAAALRRPAQPVRILKRRGKGCCFPCWPAP